MSWVIAILVLAALIAIGVYAVGAHTRALLGPVGFNVTKERVMMGESLGCSLRLQPTGTLQLNGITLTCRGYEWIQWTETESYRDSKGNRKTRRVTRTRTHDVYRKSVELGGVARLDAKRPFEADAKFRIPDDGPCTMSAPDNAIRWELALHIDIRGLPDVQETYGFNVQPARKRRKVARG